MIVFKTFLKILNKCKAPIIMYTVILIFFAGFNMKTNDNQMGFTASKPDVYIANCDENVGITKDFIEYMESISNIVSLDEEIIDDALFYRDVNFVLYIPKNFNQDFFAGKEPSIDFKGTGDYLASLASMQVEKYMKLASLYKDISASEEELFNYIHTNLEHTIEVQVTTKLDTDSLTQATFYFNFTNYCLLAGCIYVICLVLSSFKNELIDKRTIISSMDYKKYSWQLLLSNGLFAVVLWLFYVLLGIILIGKIMFSLHGVLYIVNSFVFMICTLTIAFLLGNLVRNKEAVNGIVNVIALGSSFLCGSFVPLEYLPSGVIGIAHALPSYYFIYSNNLIKSVEEFTFSSLQPILFNMFVILLFSLVFVLLSLLVNARKRKIA